MTIQIMAAEETRPHSQGLSSFSHPPRAREGTRGECHKQIFKTGYLVSPELQDFDFKNIDNVKGRE